MKQNKNINYISLSRLTTCLTVFSYSLITNFSTLKIGLNEKDAALFVSLATLISSVGIFLGGVLGDSRNRKNILLITQIMMIVISIISSLLTTSIVLIYLLITTGFLSGIINPIYNLLIIDNSSTQEDRKQGFARLYLYFNVGVAVGPSLIGILFQEYLFLFFLLVAVVNSISLYGVTRISHTSLIEKVEINSVDEKEKESSLKNTVIFIIVSMLNYFIYIQISFSVPLQINKIFDDGPQFYGYLMSANALIVILSTSFIVNRLRKQSSMKLISLGALFYGISFILMLIPSLTNLFLFIITCTIGEILVQTNLNVVISEISPSKYVGKSSSALMLLGSLFSSFGATSAGFILNNFSFTTLWIFFAICSFVYSLMMLIMRKYLIIEQI